MEEDLQLTKLIDELEDWMTKKVLSMTYWRTGPEDELWQEEMQKLDELLEVYGEFHQCLKNFGDV